MSLLQQALVFLAAAVVAVPLFKKLGLGSVLGYLAAGMVIGPWGIGAVPDVESILHFSEFGVVLLLFIIGLELEPARLWALRRTVFGLGGAQVLGTGALLAGVGVVAGLKPATAAVVGLGLSLSSTAFALQLLSEKNELPTPHGQASFGILLFQDLAVIPLLALLPLLGGTSAASEGPSAGPGWLSALKGLAVLAGVIGAGRYLVRPVFRRVAAAHSQELFTATALLLVIGTAVLVNAVGLSMALGAFLAGVLLADSEFRHELEADIEPFKGLLLGLFFIAVGMSVNIGLIAASPLRVLAWVLGLVALKALVLFGLGRWRLGSTESALSLALIISQGGEFAFVLFGLAVGLQVMDQALADLMVVTVSLSMAVTPLLFAAYTRWLRPRLQQKAPRAFDVSPQEDNPVLIAGFGRVGQVVGRLLRAKRIGFTALDISSENIDFLKRFGNNVHYGDASRLELLRAARADKAKVFVLAIDDAAASLRTAETVLQHFPHLTIFARARNRQHAYQLLNLGIKNIMRETWVSSLEMGGGILEALGLTYSESRSALERFRQHDEDLLVATSPYHRDEKKLSEMAAQARKELESIFEQDARKSG
ncbi:monovalent cation:proton antiporter-2 (CPA2) family protein [Stigmatella aurantiaca]|uniref:Glutathione-regulated potassium-efflux system n=1 Tax=Stigmatella aurantiaca (strain DW4/3-1) TaxID=378806 RepID=Q092E5_STIAD|nr:monovalent cation:proton antiporter-2 (CPA2) family protein [Stigmatella aurantiaca]ADO69680.1 Glutathione-regulated potassium-efflux system [Stigmatella aurantiaca DW4/3-1]EAU66611.1 KefC [Stigmatella aurantiaca DW4/3-1]